jgi:uncharacterized protein YgiM (DUF1202 family)
VLAIFAVAAANTAQAARELLQVFVAEPYLELHTGPGRGYPIAQVVARGEAVDVLTRKTEWYKVRSERGVEGWAFAQELAKTTLADGTLFTYKRGDRSGFADHSWENGVLLGNYAGATVVSTFGAWSFTDSMKLELSLSQFLGNRSNGYTVDVGLTQVIMPEWRISPFLTLGTGYERVVPKATLATPVDQDSQTAYAGFGARYYLTRRFFLRGEYRHHTVFTSRDSNEVKHEWKIGFAYFY